MLMLSLLEPEVQAVALSTRLLRQMVINSAQVIILRQTHLPKIWGALEKLEV